ncbi:MAG: polyphosphate kinase [Gammaproteobacteria bacterium]
MKARKLIEEKIQIKKLATEPAKPVKNPSKKIDELQLELLRAQLALLKDGKRCIVMMEGTDTAGKGGIIRRLTRHLDPRSAHVWPIGAPARWEQARHYLYRFWQKLPEPGEITIFDRSWYGRVLVERVEGFATETEWKRAYRELNEFERQLTDDGVILIKIFLHLSKEAQYNRFMERIKEPTKRWKLTVADLKSRRFWKDYQQAYEDMLNKTATRNAPWYVIPADDKDAARIMALTTIADCLKKQVDPERVNLLEPAVMTAIIEEFGEDVLHNERGWSVRGKSD